MYAFRRFVVSISLVTLFTLTGCLAPQSDQEEGRQSDKTIQTGSTSQSPSADQLTNVDLRGESGKSDESEDSGVAPGAETSPVAENDLTADKIEDLWQRIRLGFQLEHEIDRKRVQQELNWYRRHPEYIDRVTKRASRHLFYIVEELEKRNLPLEIALLPIVESAFDPFAYSHGRASGLWQFIPPTARLYNLKIDWWYDGRRDVIDSTIAAIAYLEKLHSLLGEDWLLALAAYNSGQGNIGKSIRQNERKGKPTDFWSLWVLQETRSYVPRLLAISEIIANPERYNIDLKPIKNIAYWTEVDIGSQLDLGKAAELAAMTHEELYRLNAGYNQWSTHPDGPHRLLIPVEKAALFSQALAELPGENRMAWKRHKIREGESLGSIAARYHTTIESIRSINKIKGNLIRTGKYLTIPVASSNTTYQMTANARLKQSQAGLSRKYGQDPIRYTVRHGDSFWDISREHNVGMRELAKWNGMGTTEMLKAGRELLIYKQPDQQVSPRSDVIRKVNYRVRRGESLSLIADKFNLSVNKIKGWNQALYDQKYIQPGDKITLYVDVTATE